MKTSKKRGTPRRQKKRARKTYHATLGKTVTDQRIFVPVTPKDAAVALSNEPMMQATFIGTLTLTAEQIAALRRPVEDAEVDWKPAEKDGPPIIPYLSHNGYRDRLDAAFGLGGWGMLPLAMPKEKDGAIFTPYALVIGGVPRVYAWGEQQLHKMSYGDGIEGAKSNAIVRCGKELGIGRELWNRNYIAALKHRKSGATWRTPAAPDVPSPRGGEPITEPQRLRLWTIVKKTGRPKEQVGIWLAARYNITDSKLITRADYPFIIEQLEQPGPLRLPEEE